MGELRGQKNCGWLQAALNGCWGLACNPLGEYPALSRSEHAPLLHLPKLLSGLIFMSLTSIAMFLTTVKKKYYGIFPLILEI